jgi:hypothetical protein
VPVPPEQTKKQLQEARRAEKVAEFKKKQATAKRNRIIGIVAASVGGAAVIGLVVTLVIVTSTPKVDPATIEIADVQTWDDLPATHVEGTVDYQTEYGMTPPAGGEHNGVWLNCGVYTEPQTNENAVHALEHGAVWATYDASAVSEEDLNTLIGDLPSTYTLVTPYVGLPTPIVLSAWGAQIEVTSVDDPRIEKFVDKYWKSALLAEQGAACTGGIDGPGKVS